MVFYVNYRESPKRPSLKINDELTAEGDDGIAEDELSEDVPLLADPRRHDFREDDGDGHVELKRVAEDDGQRDHHPGGVGDAGS